MAIDFSQPGFAAFDGTPMGSLLWTLYHHECASTCVIAESSDSLFADIEARPPAWRALSQPRNRRETLCFRCCRAREAVGEDAELQISAQLALLGCAALPPTDVAMSASIQSRSSGEY